MGDSAEYPEYLTTSQAGKRLGYTPHRIGDMLREGKLLGHQLPSGHWRVPRAEVERLMPKDAASLLQVAEPRWESWDHKGVPNSASFITVDVRSQAPIESDCWACVSFEDPTQPPFMLHWAGHEYSMKESDPDFITITSDVPARLDVLFIPTAPNRHLGLPNLAEWDGRGCWIARPAALDDPRPGISAYLEPGEYLIRLKIYCRREILSFEETYQLISPESPGELLFRPLPASSNWFTVKFGP